MTIGAIDPHQTVKDLTAAGFADDQAEALTQARRQVQQIDLSDLATKADLAATKICSASGNRRFAKRGEAGICNVRREMAELKTELIQRVLGIGFAQLAAIVALLRLLPGGASLGRG